jgi:protein-tyrosine-phosphatase
LVVDISFYFCRSNHWIPKEEGRRSFFSFRKARAILSVCPECETRIVEWNIEDPYFLEYEEAKNIYVHIENKVEELAKSL